MDSLEKICDLDLKEKCTFYSLAQSIRDLNRNNSFSQKIGAEIPPEATAAQLEFLGKKDGMSVGGEYKLMRKRRGFCVRPFNIQTPIQIFKVFIKLIITLKKNTLGSWRGETEWGKHIIIL